MDFQLGRTRPGDDESEWAGNGGVEEQAPGYGCI